MGASAVMAVSSLVQSYPVLLLVLAAATLSLQDSQALPALAPVGNDNLDDTYATGPGLDGTSSSGWQVPKSDLIRTSFVRSKAHVRMSHILCFC